MFVRPQPPRGSYLLQTAASSSLGHQVIGIARRLGFKTINVVRKSQHVKELKDIGYASAFDVMFETGLSGLPAVLGSYSVQSALTSASSGTAH